MDSTNPKSPQTALQQKLKDALDARDALEDILRAIGESPGELEAIFDVILEKALRLCHAQIGVVFLYDEGLFEAVGMLRWKDPGFKRKATRERAVRDKMFGFVDNAAAVSDFVLEKITIIARVALLIELLRPIQQLANALRRSV